VSDASHWLAAPSHLDDYVRYCASVSRASEVPSEPDENPGVTSAGGSGEGAGGGIPEPGRSARPAGILVIAIIVALEASALLGAALWYGSQLLTGAPVLSFWGAVFTLGLLLALSAWLFAVARFLFRGYRWPRASALVAQLFTLTIGFPTLTGGYPLAGLAMLVPAAVAILLLFDKRVIAFASRTGGAPPAL
jgi:hypothetical protein